MLEHTTLRALFAGALVALVTSACGETATESGSPQSDKSSSSQTEPNGEPRAEAQAKDKADKRIRQQRREARCAELGQSVSVGYRVMTRPIATGKEIWLMITVRNDTDHYVGGPFGGRLWVTAAHPGQPRPMNWGGSSSDEAGAEPHTTFAHRVLNLNGRPLRTPADARVSNIDLDYTSLQLCPMPVRMRAPRGLVTEHPSGRWHVTADGDEVSGPGR